MTPAAVDSVSGAAAPASFKPSSLFAFPVVLAGHGLEGKTVSLARTMLATARVMVATIPGAGARILASLAEVRATVFGNAVARHMHHFLPTWRRIHIERAAAY